MAEAPRVVLDANLIVRGLLTPHGAGGRLLGGLARGRFAFVTSESILYEVATILSEPRVQRYGPFPRDEIRQRTDAKDDPIVACALEGDADYIVTDDRRDLLPLMVIRVAGHKAVQIVAPTAFLKSAVGR